MYSLFTEYSCLPQYKEILDHILEHSIITPTEAKNIDGDSLDELVKLGILAKNAVESLHKDIDISYEVTELWNFVKPYYKSIRDLEKIKIEHYDDGRVKIILK